MAVWREEMLVGLMENRTVKRLVGLMEMQLVYVAVE